MNEFKTLFDLIKSNHNDIPFDQYSSDSFSQTEIDHYHQYVDDLGKKALKLYEEQNLDQILANYKPYELNFAHTVFIPNDEPFDLNKFVIFLSAFVLQDRNTKHQSLLRFKEHLSFHIANDYFSTTETYFYTSLAATLKKMTYREKHDRYRMFVSDSFQGLPIIDIVDVIAIDKYRFFDMLDFIKPEHLQKIIDMPIFADGEKILNDYREKPKVKRYIVSKVSDFFFESEMGIDIMNPVLAQKYGRQLSFITKIPQKHDFVHTFDILISRKDLDFQPEEFEEKLLLVFKKSHRWIRSLPFNVHIYFQNGLRDYANEQDWIWDEEKRDILDVFCNQFIHGKPKPSFYSLDPLIEILDRIVENQTYESCLTKEESFEFLRLYKKFNQPCPSDLVCVF